MPLQPVNIMDDRSDERHLRTPGSTLFAAFATFTVDIHCLFLVSSKGSTFCRVKLSFSRQAKTEEVTAEVRRGIAAEPRPTALRAVEATAAAKHPVGT